MSVILDALKRVQDENRRRGGSTERPEPRGDGDQRSPNALLRRLSEPTSAPAPKRDGLKVSPVIWASGALVLLVLLVAAGLAWFQPTFDGPAVNDGRPLLTQLEGRSAGAPVSSTPSSAVRESFGGDPSGGASGNGAGDEPAAAMAAGEDEQQGGGDLFSDLSANLDSADESVGAASAPAAAGASTASEDDSMLRLQVEERPAATGSARPAAGTTAASQSDSFLDIRSATPGQAPTDSAASPQREWVPPTSTGVEDTVDAPLTEEAGRVPTRLVDPGVRAAFAEGVRRHKSGDLGGAAQAYERALKLDPSNARVNANLGVLYESQGKLVPAERHLREAVQTEPDNAAAHNNLGVVLYRQGKYDAALIEFNRTLQLDPRRLDAYTNKGLIYTRWGQLEDAERSFRQVLAIDSTNALAHYNLGLVYEEMGHIAQAVESYYRFLDHGGAQHPEITDYLDRHLRWLERRSQSGDGTGS